LRNDEAWLDALNAEIILRKTIKVTKGELKLFDDIRYFFSSPMT